MGDNKYKADLILKVINTLQNICCEEFRNVYRSVIRRACAWGMIENTSKMLCKLLVLGCVYSI